MELKTDTGTPAALERIAVFSDTHGNTGGMTSALTCPGGFTRMFHLGDGIIEGAQAARDFHLPFTGVAGNEDSGNSFREREIVDIRGFRFLLMHGHQLRVNAYMNSIDRDRLFDAMAEGALFEGADALLFGHSHQAALETRKGVILCNPGDQYCGSSLPHSFGVIEIHEKSFSVSIMRRSADGTWQSEMKEVKGRA